VVGWEEVPPRKGEMGCFGRKRYLMILGRTFLFSVVSEGWDVGRDEEKRCCWIFCLKIVRSPRRILGWASIAAVVIEEFSYS
jgi:hypothetical protein